MTDDAPALQQPAQPLTGREPVLVTAENKPQVDAWRAYLAGGISALWDAMNEEQQTKFYYWNWSTFVEKRGWSPMSNEYWHPTSKRARLRAAYIILTRGAA